MNRKVLFFAVLSVLMLVFAAGTMFFQNRQNEAAAKLAERNRASLMRMHSPGIGRPDAPVVIVEFFDPACGTCRAFYGPVKDMMKASGERIRLVLRYAPFHPGSDRVVAILEASRRQGKFWPVLEALLAAQPDWVIEHRAQLDRVWRHLDGLGLNLEQLRADMNAPEIARVIAQDVEDARALNVSQTPEYFVNGRPLPSFGYEQLKQLVDDALAAAPR
jgi:protein-disulfide isomerase